MEQEPLFNEHSFSLRNHVLSLSVLQNAEPTEHCTAAHNLPSNKWANVLFCCMMLLNWGGGVEHPTGHNTQLESWLSINEPQIIEP